MIPREEKKSAVLLCGNKKTIDMGMHKTVLRPAIIKSQLVWQESSRLLSIREKKILQISFVELYVDH